MKKSLVVMGILAILAITGCAGCTVAPDAGEEAVLVMKPLLFGHGGIDRQPVQTGRIYIAWTTTPIIINMQPQQFSVHFDDLMSSDGVPLDFDSVIRILVIDSVTLVEKFGPNWYKNNVEMEFMNRVRQAVRKHGMNETAIETKAIDAIDTEVTAGMEENFQQAGLPLKLIQVTVGKANPPDAIKNQRVKTAEEQQRQVTELQRKMAEDNRAGAEESRAVADNAYRNNMGFTPAQFITYEYVHRVLMPAAEKGECTFFVDAPGAVVSTPNNSSLLKK